MCVRDRDSDFLCLLGVQVQLFGTVARHDDPSGLTLASASGVGVDDLALQELDTAALVLADGDGVQHEGG